MPPLVQRDATTLPPSEINALLRLLRDELPASVIPYAMDHRPLQPWRRTALPLPQRTVLDSLRARCGDGALDTWMAALLRAWLQDIGSGTARKMRWVVPATAVLGGDACAALLGPHLRGENHALRCTGDVGVSALVEIGTRGALLELAHLGRKFPQKFRGQMAQQALQAIGDAQGISPEQLQDRILADGGLDAAGRRTFDYGPRQFEVLLDEYLAPILRTADGCRLTSLPKPTTKDDAVRAAEARNDWKIAKTQIQQAARWLAARFEGAMISGETWSVTGFNEYFRRHPLARYVVRRLLWTSVSTDGRAATCFRVAEDDTLADSNDAPLELSDGAMEVRPIHPMEMESGVRETWQRLFAEYNIVGPFPQLDRPVFRLPAEYAAQKTVTSFPHSRFEVKALVFPLENRGWTREEFANDGMVTHHLRRFPRAGVTACVEYTPGAFLGGLLSSGVQTLTQLTFFASTGRPIPSAAMALGQVPPLVYSETLRDIHALVPA